MPKLASEHVGTGEETKGAALASRQEVLFVFVKGIGDLKVDLGHPKLPTFRLCDDSLAVQDFLFFILCSHLCVVQTFAQVKLCFCRKKTTNIS